jgi:hypothetical protein
LHDTDNPLALSRALTDWLIDRAGIRGPAVVIGFAGLHYPPSRLDPDAPADAALLRAVRAAEAALATETTLTWRPHFQGISDMSFLGQPARAGDAVVADNTPAAKLVDRPGARALAFPVVNIGPWGREFHQRLERVHAPYAFDTLPRLWRIWSTPSSRTGAMTAEQSLILAILALTMGLFLWGRWRHDVVALAALLACVVAGLVPPAQAFDGFAHPAVITVACVLVLSRGLQTTGAVDMLTRTVMPQAGGRIVSMAALLGLGAGLSAFMNNVGAMALLMPVAVQLAGGWTCARAGADAAWPSARSSAA